MYAIIDELGQFKKNQQKLYRFSYQKGQIRIWYYPGSDTIRPGQKFRIRLD
jgi:hypothetical protein